MNQYSIYCSAEQTRKAFELGAPCITNDVALGCHIANPEKFVVRNEMPCVIVIPTAEEMIGWLEKQGIFINIDLTCDFKYQSYLKTLKNADHNIISEVLHHSSRQEATLAAIDEALDCLLKAKEE